MSIYQGKKLISGTPNLTEIETKLNNKVDKIDGKGLSTNDFTNSDKTKLNGIEQNANNYSLPVATENELGGVKIGKNLSIDNEGKLNVEVTIPQATTEIGGIRANPKTELDTTEVKIDTNTGYLYCSSGNGGGSNLDGKQDKPTTNNTAYGLNSLTSLTTGSNNTGIGFNSLQNITTGRGNVGIGTGVMQNSISASFNIGIGDNALANLDSGSSQQNVAIGEYSLSQCTTGVRNNVLGAGSMQHLKTGSYNSCLGYGCLNQDISGKNITTLNNCSAVGYDTRVSGDNQVQLGNSQTTTYCYGVIQNRSDKRDKSDIQETELGLEFISKLKPRQFKWNYRDDYKGEENDGSKKRNRYHQGFIAQEVKTVIDELGIDFGGYQDHSINGGCDVLSLGYEEFIAPMVKAIQEQQQMIDKQQNLIQNLEDRISKLEQK